MEKSRKAWWDRSVDRPKPEAEPVHEVKNGVADLSDVLHFAYNQKLPGDASDSEESSASSRDFTSAIDLVHQAAETIRAADERARRSEAEARTAIEERAQAERRAEEAQALLKAAETRAREAEEWLQRLHDAILSKFGSVAQLGEMTGARPSKKTSEKKTAAVA